MHVSETGLRMVEAFEGFRSRPYRDAVGVWTIGYGETKNIGPGTPPISQAQAEKLLRSRIARDYEPSVNNLHVPLNQNQFDALVSFVYNLGPGVLSPSSTMGARLRSHNYSGAADAFVLYTHAGGRVLLGLVNRRRAERALFLKPGGAVSRLVKWRAELKHRRAQLRTEKNPGTRHFLQRRITALKAAIKKARG